MQDKTLGISIVVTTLAACLDIWCVKDTKKIRAILSRTRRKLLSHDLQKTSVISTEKCYEWLDANLWKNFPELSCYIIGFLFTATITVYLMVTKYPAKGDTFALVKTEYLYYGFPAGLYGGVMLMWLRSYIEWARNKNVFYLVISIYFIKWMFAIGIIVLAIMYVIITITFSVYCTIHYGLSPSNTKVATLIGGYAMGVLLTGLPAAISPVFLILYLVHLEVLTWLMAKVTQFLDRSLNMLLKVTRNFYFSTSTGAVCTFVSVVVFVYHNIPEEVISWWKFFWTPELPSTLFGV